MSQFKHLLSEIHRRSLWQVLAIYLVGAWAVFQVVGSIYEWIGLPRWVPGAALVLLLLFLPVVLATAFVQEGGPGLAAGESGGNGADHDASGRAPPGRPADPMSPVSGTAPPRKAGLFTWHRVLTAGVLAFALLGVAATGFMGMRALGIGPAATLITSGTLDARDRIVLADFHVSARDTTLGTLVTEALRIDLAESPVVRLAPEALVQATLQRMRHDPADRLDEALAREVALREGLKAVLAGDVRQAGGTFVLSARLVTPDSDRILAAFRETAADSGALVATIDRLSEEIRRKIGESLRTVRAAKPLERVTTSSLAALRLYSQGRYQQAVEVDSTFAMAWRKISVNLSNYNLLRSRQVEAATRAYELRNRLGARERLLAEETYAETVQGDPRRAERALTTLLASYPDDDIALNNLGVNHSWLGNDRAAADDFRRSIEALPVKPMVYASLATAQYDLGDVTGAFATLDSARFLFPRATLPLYIQAAILATEGRFAESDSVASELRAVSKAEFSVANWLAHERESQNAATRGRVRESLEHIRLLRAGARQSGLDLLVPTRITLAARAARYVAGIFGDTAEARRILREALNNVRLETLDRLDRPFGDLAYAYVYAGDPWTAATYADSVVSHHWHAGDPEFGSELRARGLIALQAGRPDEALEYFRRVREEIPGCQNRCALALTGRAYEAAGQPDSAIAAYERFLAARINDALQLGFVLEHLGQLHEQRGDREDAARYYARFIDLWRDADPELQPRVDAARRALSRLTAEG